MDYTLKTAAEEWDKVQVIQLTEKPQTQRLCPVSLFIPLPIPTLSPPMTSFGDTQEFGDQNVLVLRKPPEPTDLVSKFDKGDDRTSEISFSQCLEQMAFPLKTDLSPSEEPRTSWRRFVYFNWLKRRYKLKHHLLAEREFIYSAAYTSCQPFENALHGKMLYTIFKKFTGSSAYLTKGDHWELIGFQGADPTTDFRGGGLLALLCLVFFATESVFCNTITTLFRNSLDPVRHFPFSLIGINVTTLLLQTMHRGRFNRLYNNRNSVIHTFMLLYSGLFYEFCRRWEKKKCTINRTQEILICLQKRCRRNPREFLRITNCDIH